MTYPSLRKQLLITIIGLMLFVSAAIVWVSIRAGTNAVNNMTQRVMLNMIERIDNDNQHHLNEAVRALETIAPQGNTYTKQQSFPTDQHGIEQRLSFAGNLFAETTNYVYFAGPDGSFLGFHPANNQHVDLYVHNLQDRLPAQDADAVANKFDARQRPWYINALNHKRPMWTEVYDDFTDHQPTITLSKPVYQPDRSLAGVVATDLKLFKLSEYLRTNKISAHSVAYIVDSSGYMIASSGNEYPFDLRDNRSEKKLAESMSNQLIQQSYLNVVKDQINGANLPVPASKSFDFNDEKYDVAFASLGEKNGLKWVSVVAVPRSDFMSEINQSLLQSLLVVVVFIALALCIGLVVIEHMLRDIRQLTSAALKIGNGEPLPRLHIHRKDEIGHLVKTFIEMENKLRFDRLTQVNNRDFLIAQIEFLQRHAAQHPSGKVNFTLLFLDLDKFKAINDSYGHAAGDQLLIVIASRLKAAVRETDTVARFGGDEFVVLLNGTSNSIDIQATVDKIHALVEQPIALSDHIVSVRVSVGWAIFPVEALSYAGLIEIADARMFTAKKAHNEVYLRLVDNPRPKIER
jgi:diguanylate cyclase (GGDEF)-like protein